MRFPHIRDAPVAEAKRQRSVFGFTRFLIASWIYYTLLHPYTVIQYMIIDPEPDLTVPKNSSRRFYPSGMYQTLNTHVRDDS
jgi:hypothetical protein